MCRITDFAPPRARWRPAASRTRAALRNASFAASCDAPARRPGIQIRQQPVRCPGGGGEEGMSDYVTSLMASVKAKNPAEPEFHQAVQEVVDSLAVVLDQHPEYRHEKILHRIIEPERVIMV